MKTCVQCGQEKAEDEFYLKGDKRGRPDRRRNDCKVCTRATRRRRYQANPEFYCLSTRRYRQQHREAVRLRKRRYRASHLQQARQWGLHYVRKLSAAQRRLNGQRDYRKHFLRFRKNDQIRRARLANAPQIEPVKIMDVAERDGWRCHLCGKRVTRRSWSLDHLVPLAQGGSHTMANIALAHRLCNARRGNGRLPAQLRLLG